MANLWNVVNLNLDDQSGMVQIGNGHPLLMYLNLLVTPPPPGGGQHTIDVHKLQLLALALCKGPPSCTKPFGSNHSWRFQTRLGSYY